MGTHSPDSQPGLLPGLSIIHGNRLEDLRDVAVHWISTHSLGVLETEQFIVQSNGMAQWLKLALAEDDGCGISAGLETQLPGTWVWTAYRAILGDDTIPTDSPYDRERLVWRFFSILPTLLTDDTFSSLNRFLEGDTDQRRQYQLACRLADLFDQYQVYRADWLKGWAEGKDQLLTGGGRWVDIPPQHAWQAELWRRLRARVPAAIQNIGRSDLHQAFLQKASDTRVRPAMLPPRVIVFGISSLPKQVLETLYAVSHLCQVLLFVNNPCRHFWADIIEDRELLRIDHARHSGKETMPTPLDPVEVYQHANPLLAAWGKQGRDYIGLVYGYDAPETYRKNFAEIDLFRDVVPLDDRGTLLHEIQQAILDLEPPAPDSESRRPVARGDRTIAFQVAHSRQREVEILQDQLLHSFETLDHLLPRDVVVMTPDIEGYAPHIEAVFGNLTPDNSRFIPFTIADHPGKKSVPLVKALERLLRLPDLRMATRDFMDLLEVPAFQRRFGFEETDLPRLFQWIKGAGISWGLNQAQRASFGLPPDLDQTTWAFGLNRMLLGYAVGTNKAWRNIEPYDEIGGLEAHLVGRVANVVERLESLWTTLQSSASPEQWCRCLRTLARDFFEPVDAGERLVLNRMDQVLDDWLNACTQADLDQELTLSVVRDYFLEKMAVQGVSQKFLAGMVNFGTLMPMRAIPFRVVCLLGMNDGAFPRSHPPLDFDLMAEPGMYRPGDRSTREDDRYLFLEALLSARERFYLSHVGRDVRDNSERTPSVLVGQLRDYINAGWYLEPGCAEPEHRESGCPEPERPEPGQPGHEDLNLVDYLTTVHPLQPFGRVYFTGQDASLFTYALEWQNCLGRQNDPPREQRLETPPCVDALTLGPLTGFMKNPVKFFYTHCLSIRFDDIGLENLDHEPFALDLLAPFNLGATLLSAGLAAGIGPELYPGRGGPSVVEAAVVEAADRLTRTGELPMAGFGTLAAENLATPVIDMLTRYGSLVERWPRPCDPMEIALVIHQEGWPEIRLDDWLDNMITRDAVDPGAFGPQFARQQFYPRNILDRGGKLSLVYPLVSLWVGHVAGCAMGIDLTSHLIAPDAVAAFHPLDKPAALTILMEILTVFRQGLARPLPVTAKTGVAYAAALVAKDEQRAKNDAARVYAGDGFNARGELGYDPYLQRTFPDFDSLWQAHDTLFKDLAATLYAPMVQAVVNEE